MHEVSTITRVIARKNIFPPTPPSSHSKNRVPSIVKPPKIILQQSKKDIKIILYSAITLYFTRAYEIRFQEV